MSKTALQSFLNDFSEDYELGPGESDQTKFEHLCAWLLIRTAVADAYDPGDYVSGPGETGIDGGCIAINGDPVMTEEDCDNLLKAAASASVDLHVVLFQSKLSESVSSQEMLTFANAAADLFDPEGELPQDAFLDGLRSVMGCIRKRHLSKLRQTACSLFFCTVSGNATRTLHHEQARRRIEEGVKALGIFDDERVSAKDLRYPEIVRRWRDASTFHRCELAYEERLLLKRGQAITEALVARVKAKDFVEQVLRASTGDLRTGVFDRNVRAYLGDKNQVNSDIIATLADSEKRSLFSLMNNGVTIVAHSLSDRARKLVLEGYQIVNGGQTSNVLHRAYGHLDDSVEILVRVIVADSWAVLDDIIRATNSQTSIPIYQLAANSEKLLEIAQYCHGQDEREVVHIERRTGQFFGKGEIKSTRTFSIPVLAQCFAAIFLEKPHRVSSAPNSIYTEFRDEIFCPEHSPRLYYASAWAHYVMRNCIKNLGFRVGPMRIYWHVLLCARMLVELNLPNLKTDANRAAKVADALVEATRTSAKALPLLKQALDIVQEAISEGVGPRSAGLVTRYRAAVRELNNKDSKKVAKTKTAKTKTAKTKKKKQ